MRDAGMRYAYWQRVDEVSAQPHSGGWAVIPVPDDITAADLCTHVLDASKLTAPAELYVRRSGPLEAYQLLRAGDELPEDLLAVKVVAPKSGVLCSVPCFVCATSR